VTIAITVAEIDSDREGRFLISRDRQNFLQTMGSCKLLGFFKKIYHFRCPPSGVSQNGVLNIQMTVNAKKISAPSGCTDIV
jgi:hypothetical protein